MTGSELKEARHKLGLTQPALAASLGVNLRTLVGWELGNRNGRPAAVPVAVALAVEALKERARKEEAER